MDIETVRIEDFITTMSNLPEPLGFTNSVLINIHEVIKEYLIEEESGLTTLIGSYINPTSRILLRPLNFDLPHLSVLLHHELNRDLSFCRFLAANIAFSVEVNSLHQRPFLISVNVIINKEVRFISQPVVSVSMSSGASSDVFERLLEEQKVESFDLDETCSICIDKLLETSSEIHESNIIQMPNCLHLFHQDCIFEWLSRHNSCPLCRRVPYKEEDQD